MPGALFKLPYDGAKEMLLIKQVESDNFLEKLFNEMYEELLAPKRKI